MSAPVRIEARAWTDIRFATLARLLGLADSDHALIKVARLWSWQTEHFTPDSPTYEVDADTIESVLGSDGPAALVRAKLADRTTTGYRLRGTEGQIEWCDTLTSKRQHAGQARANGAKRDSRGRLLPRESGVPDYDSPAPIPAQGPASTSTPPAQSSAPDPAPSPEDQKLSLPRDPAVPPPEPTPVPAVSPPAPEREDIARTQPAEKPATAPASGVSLETLWSEFEAERQRVAKALRIELLPLAAHDRGRHDLAQALSAARLAGERDLEVKRIRRAIASAGGEAEGGQDTQWLTGGVFTQDNLRRLAGTTPAKAKQAAADRRAAMQARARGQGSRPESSSAPAPTKRETAPLQMSTMTPEERVEAAAEERARLTLLLADGARAPPASAAPMNTETTRKPGKEAT